MPVGRGPASTLPRFFLPMRNAKKLEPFTKTYVDRPPPVKQKLPYLIRPFTKDPHLEALQSVENRGMYKRELSIERGRFPKVNRALVLQCDGSLNEVEMEFSMPPFIPLFRDRTSVRAEQQQLVFKSGRDTTLPFWRNKKLLAKPDMDLCNATAFPYAVPSKTPARPPVRSALEPGYEEYRARAIEQPTQ